MCYDIEEYLSLYGDGVDVSLSVSSETKLTVWNDLI